MTTPLPVSTPSPQRPWVLGAAVLGLVYAFGHLGWFIDTPLGRVPVLDERENLQLATQIATGTLPAEPFYRAMGYPLVLAGFLRIGIAPEGLMAGALTFGALLHAFNALLAGWASQRLFRSTPAGAATTLLLGLNPVLLHYAVSVLDATLATTFFLLGLLALFRGSAPALLASGAAWALAALTRPQFLPLFLALPLATWLAHRTSRAALLGLGAIAVGGLGFVAQGCWQQQVSGAFRVMPWQGAYNLWAANKPGAHGRYFTQSIQVTGSSVYQNPTRLESLALYAQETGRDPAIDGVDAVNRHWNARFLARVREDPTGWLRQLAGRVYALLNKWEQYNNKTYAFHQARSPWLWWNPLGWGLLLMLAIPGAWLLARNDRPAATALALTAAIYAASVVLFFVSARFRLPLVVVLGILGGGALANWRRMPRVSSREYIALTALSTVAMLLAFTRFAGVHDRSTFVQDHLLLARAAQQAGDDALAFEESLAAQRLAPQRPDAAELLVTSWFNQALAHPLPVNPQIRAAAHTLQSQRDVVAPASVAVAGFVLAAAGERDAAATTWRATPSPEALAGLAWSGLASAEERRQFNALPTASVESSLVRLAREGLAAPERDALGRRFFGR